MRFVTILFFLINLFFSLPVYAATYYISPTGNDTMGNGSIDNPWNTFRKGISVLRAGDTLYCRGGTYTKVDDMAATAANGTSNSPITVRNYTGETPVFRSRANPTYVSSVVTITNSYWIFDGLQFRPTDTTARTSNVMCFYIPSGTNNILRNLYVESTTASNGVYTFNQIIRIHSNYNEIYSSTLIKGGDPTDMQGNTGQVIVIIGGSYNKIHNNNLQRGVHDLVYLTNDGANLASYNQVYSNTCTHSMGYAVDMAGAEYTLVQDNNITGCNEDLTYVKTPIFINAGNSANNIIRRNVGWGGGKYGLANRLIGNGNHVYNNVFYNNGSDGWWGFYDPAVWPAPNYNKYYNNVFAHNMTVSPWGSYYAEVADVGDSPYDFWADNLHNEMKSNFIVVYKDGAWQNDYSAATYSPTLGKKTASWMEANRTGWANNIKNYCDPKFVNSSTGDFRIQSDSCLIDAGRHLTTANGSGSNSTTLIVYDAGFFWPGDIIKIGSVTATISSINYKTNTITLSSAKIWNHGDNVDLDYKGAAPDIGAFEYVFNLTPTPPSPPKNLKVVP